MNCTTNLLFNSHNNPEEDSRRRIVTMLMINTTESGVSTKLTKIPNNESNGGGEVSEHLSSVGIDSFSSTVVALIFSFFILLVFVVICAKDSEARIRFFFFSLILPICSSFPTSISIAEIEMGFHPLYLDPFFLHLLTPLFFPSLLSWHWCVPTPVWRE